MAIIRLNQLLEVIRGGIGKMVIRQRPDGTLILSGAPAYRKGKGSAKQKHHRQRVKEAARYAKWADNIYPIYAELAKKSDKWLSPYNIAFSDWFEAPVIHRMERRDGCILVEASDNVMVEKVQVTVFDADGTILERGEAARSQENWWEFATHIQGKKVVAEARDLAENATRSVWEQVNITDP
jgi:hypothetical protein